MHATITADNLIVTKDAKPILRDISFAVEPFTITGLIGPSGSGKTTHMRTIIGAQKISKGDLIVLEKPAGNAWLRSQIGYVTQSPSVYNDLTIAQNLQYFASIIGQRSQVNEVLELVDLQSHAKQVVSSLSGGEQARVSLAIALLGDPKLLVLDEPTVGLDPLLRKHLWELFARLTAKGKTVLVSSHVMDEAERCANILLLREGKLLHAGSKQTLLENTGMVTVENAFLQLVEGANNA
jgi:ABC-2 type transport system ATP-binding protein